MRVKILLFLCLILSIGSASFATSFQSTSDDSIGVFTNKNSINISTLLESENTSYNVSSGVPTGENVNMKATVPPYWYEIDVHQVTASAGYTNVQIEVKATASYYESGTEHIVVESYSTVDTYSNSVTAYSVPTSDVYPINTVSTKWSLGEAYFGKNTNISGLVTSVSPQPLIPSSKKPNINDQIFKNVNAGLYDNSADARAAAASYARATADSIIAQNHAIVDSCFSISGSVNYQFEGLYVSNDYFEGEPELDNIEINSTISIPVGLNEGTYVGEGTATFGTTEVAFNPGNIVIKEDENSQGNVWCSGDYELVATYTNMDQPISITNYVNSDDFGTASGVPKGQTLNHVIEAPECLYNIAVYKVNGRAGAENIPITVNATYTVGDNTYTTSSTDTYTYNFSNSGYEVTTSDIRALKSIDSNWMLNDDDFFSNSVSVEPISEPTAQTLSLYISKPAVQNKYVINLNIGNYATTEDGMAQSRFAIDSKIAEIKSQIKSIVDSSISISGTVDYSFKGLTVTKDNGPVGTPTITNVSRTVPFTIPTNIPTGTYVGSGGVTYGSTSTELNPNNVVVTNMLGDMDGNNSHNIIDVRLLLQSIINNSSENPYSVADMIPMDFDKNGEINIVDVRLLLQHVINQG